jgi:hypothetical protein
MISGAKKQFFLRIVLSKKGGIMAKKDKNTEEKFNTLKEFEGSRYSGMKVGATHKWYYDQGEWRERKVTPEEWDIYYETTKRRAGKAPEGTGAPVGTEYNWLVIAHQRVDKCDANSYDTFLEGKKFKVAHKRASKNTWNVKEKTQRKKVIAFLERIIEDLKKADENEEVTFTVGEGERIYGLEQKNKAELNEIASQKKIPNRSKMRRAELLAAIKNWLTDSKSKKQETEKNLSNKTKDELYELAEQRGYDGSEMKKGELIKLLKKETELVLKI